MDKKLRETAQEVMVDNNLHEVWVNENKEFFSNENRALLSVKGDKKRVLHIKKSDFDTEPGNESGTDSIKLDK